MRVQCTVVDEGDDVDAHGGGGRPPRRTMVVRLVLLLSENSIICIITDIVSINAITFLANILIAASAMHIRASPLYLTQ